MVISVKHIRAVLLAATLIGAATTACKNTSLPTGAPSISTATPPAADSTAIQAQPTTAIPATSSPTPDLEATQAALATPTEEPFHLPGGRLLFGAIVGPPEGRDTIPDGWWAKYFWLSLPDGVVEPHPVLSGEYPIRDRPVALSPDNSRLAFARETYIAGEEWYSYWSTSIYLLGPNDKDLVQITQPVAKGFIRGFSWSLDSHFVAFWNNDEWNEFGDANKNTIHIYDVQTGALKNLSVKATQPGFPELSPNGDRVVFANETYNPDTEGLYLINADGTGEQRLVEGAIFSPQWHPDGTRLIFEQADLNVDPTTGFRHIYSYALASRVVTLLTPADKSSYWFVLSPDGRSLTYISEEGGMIRLSVVGTDGGTPVQLTGGFGFDNVWSPDSQYLAYAESGGIDIMDSRGRGQVRVIDDLEMDGLLAWLP